MRTLRIISQSLFFVAFSITFFFLTTDPRGYTFQSEWFLWLNPLVGIITTIAARSWVMPALAIGGGVLLLTAVFGRFFCGWLCPLGSIIDFSDRFVTNKMYTPKRVPPRFFQRAKYFFLFALAVLALFGVIVPIFMDPISLLTRIYTLIAYPLVSVINTEGLQLFKPLLIALGLDNLAFKTAKLTFFYETLSATLLFTFIIAAGFWDKRFWCQYICPSGAFFGLASRFAIFRRFVVLDKCGECRRCIKACPTHAINDREIPRTSVAECILCGDCLVHDSFRGSHKSLFSGCTRFTFIKGKKNEAVGADIRRRHLLAGAAAGLLLVPAFRTSAWSKRDNTGRLIRPPGALPEPEFLARCISCGACMKACPTNALQPCSVSDGTVRLNTPKLVPRVGGCEEKCHLCGYACPTGAIRPLTWDDKQFAKLGTAVIDRHKCLAWAQNKECIVCDEICPYNAIEGKMVETTKGPFKAPVVFEDVCIGCGMCEQKCPIDDEAAIVVYKFGENRKTFGPYASPSQKEAMLKRRKKSDAEGSSMPGMQSLEQGAGSNQTNGLPPGFTDETPLNGSNSGLPPGFVDDKSISSSKPAVKPSGGLPPGFVE